MRRFVIPVGWVDDEAEKAGKALAPAVDVAASEDPAAVPAEPDEPEPPEQPSKSHHPKKPGRL